MELTSSHDAPTDFHPALATVAGDQCTSCSAPLASDQRYCVQCGQRRGQSQLPAAQPAAPRADAGGVLVSRRREPRFGANSALIAGVGVLLLAMGVGVLIGRSSQKDSGSRAAAPVQVVTVGGATGAATAGTGASGSQAKAGKSSSKASKATTSAKAAAHVKGTSLKLPKKAVVKVGAPGKGPGYQHGKFTGNFFGGG